MNELAEVISEAIKGNQQTGSDYTARVVKVEGSTAYVQITGSDIADTPVAMSVSCKPGDMVRVRVANGKAWITGNDSSPPTDDSAALQAIQEIRETNELIKAKAKASDGRYSKIEQTVDQITLKVGVAESKADTAQTTANGAQATANGRMKADMSNKSSSIVIGSGTMTFNSNTLVVNSTKFKLDASGNATFSGNLSAAKGTFGGSVDCSWLDSQSGYTTRTILGQNSKKTRNLYPGILVTELYGEQEGYTVIAASETTYYLTNSGVRSANINANGVNTSSDRRLKKDIVDLSPEPAKNLRPVSFRFNGEKEIHYGFVAQEVVNVLQGPVSEDANGFLSINYQELIAPLYALVQEQERHITQLEARLKALEDKLNEHDNI